MYGGPSSVFCKPSAARHSPQEDDADTEALAGFLLSLKHRSVTPEPRLESSRRKSHSNNKKKKNNRARNAATASPFHYTPAAVSRDMTPPHSPFVTSVSSTETNVSIASPAFTSATALPPLPTSSTTNTGNSPSPSLSSLIDVEAMVLESTLVCVSDRDLVPDALFAAMSQMKPCHLQESDRVGCYKNREVGFLGMSCKHCGGQPGFGRYFPNSVRSLAQTTTSQTILKHIGSKCRYAPPEIRNAILELQQQQAVKEAATTGRPRYGSRKVFFQRVWQRLHEGAVTEEEVQEKNVNSTATISNKASSVSVGSSEASVHSEEDDESRFYYNHARVVSGEKRSQCGDDGDRNSKRVKLGNDSTVTGKELSFPTQVSTHG